jgi:hypothetical protein
VKTKQRVPAILGRASHHFGCPWVGNDQILLPGGGTHAQRTGNPENVGSIADGRARFESDANSLLSLSAVDYDRGAAVVGSFSRQPGPY